MEIRTSFSRRTYLLLILAVYFVMGVLFILGIVSKVGLFFSILTTVLTVAKLNTSSVAFDKTEIAVVWYRFLIERTIRRPIENISLEIIYSGSTGNPQDAILNIFDGTKCIYQVYAHHGFTEDQFKELTAAFNDLKSAAVEVGG